MAAQFVLPAPTMKPSRRRGGLLAVAGVIAIASLGALAGAVLAPGSADLGAIERGTATVVVDLGGHDQPASGIVLTAAGEVVTAASVIEGAVSVSVSVPGHAATFRAAVVGLDPTDDLALLQLQAAGGLTPIAVGAAPAPATGAGVTAVAGSARKPTAYAATVTGLGEDVSGLNPVTGDAIALRGSIAIAGSLPLSAEGGPLVNSRGQVIGMDALAAASLPSQPLTAGYAVPAGVMARAVHDMVSGAPNPRVLRGPTAVLGVEVRDSAAPPGAMVAAVAPLSPAQAAGVMPGDVLIAIDGSSIADAVAVPDALRHHHAFEHVHVRWITPAGTVMQATALLASGTAT